MRKNRAAKANEKQFLDRRFRMQDSKEPIIIKITPFGVFAFQENKLLKKILWGKDASKCALLFYNRDAEIKKINSQIALKTKRITRGIFGEELKKIALENGFSEKEFQIFFQKFNIELTKLKLKFGFSDDKLIIQAVNNFDEVTKMINTFYERLREWYGYYSPETVEKIEHIEDFAEIVGEKRGEDSMGYNLKTKDIEIIKMAGVCLKNLLDYKQQVENYIEEKMNEFAPNISKIAGAVLGAKLIAGAGSLHKLASYPASTVQLLGAEKALFRHLRRGSKPPKYGYILQHKLMTEIPTKERGKFARYLSGKINIAAKVDYYSKGKDDITDKIIKGIEEKAKLLKGRANENNKNKR